MKRMSDLIQKATVLRNPDGIDDMLVFDYQGKRYYRTMKYENFSNYPIISVRFKSERRLVDVSCIEITWEEVS